MVVDEQQLNLGAWYAEPLEPVQAEALLRQAQQAQQHAYRQRLPCTACPFHELIARFWLGRSTDALYERLRRPGNPAHSRALAELISGQLLMSRRLAGAMERLRHGFFLAAPQLPAAEYFQILKRHELLALLPLMTKPASTQTLDALLREARVIQQLRGRHRVDSNRGDPLG